MSFPRPLIFKLQQEILKVNANFLNLENRSFKNVKFSQ